MTTQTIERAGTTGIGTPASSGRDRDAGLVAVRRGLQGLVERFEAQRRDVIAANGVTPVAAYDAGVRDSIREALARLGTVGFGRCVRCGHDIDIDRLRSMPYVRRCAGCQRREEEGWDEVERLVASVVRSNIGEPQGRATPATSPDETIRNN